MEAPLRDIAEARSNLKPSTPITSLHHSRESIIIRETKGLLASIVLPQPVTSS